MYNIIFPEKLLYIYNFDCSVPVNIIFQFVSSYLILNLHFHKLHYFSIFLSLGIFIIILIIDIINIVKHESFDPYALVFYIIYLLLLSVEYALGKKVILFGYISIYLLLLMRGFIKIIFMVLLSVFFIIFDSEVFINLGLYLKQNKNTIYSISNIFIFFSQDIFLWLIIDRFSPNYIPLAYIFKQISDFLIEIIITKNIEDSNPMGWELYFRIFLYLILIISVMIHNEIIIINICGLGSNTKYFLDLKYNNELLYYETDDPEILERFETYIELDDKTNDDKGTINNQYKNNKYLFEITNK